MAIINAWLKSLHNFVQLFGVSQTDLKINKKKLIVQLVDYEELKSEN